MKKITFILAIAIFTFSTGFAQRFAYVNTDYILEKIPAYNDAQKQLDEIAGNWQKEIEAKYKEIDEMYKAYQAEQVLLTEEMKMERQRKIENKEKEVKAYQKRKFGYEGDLFKKRQELIKPIQDDIYDEIQKMAKAKSFDFVFDKANGPTMLFANSKYDLSDKILQELGVAEVQGQNLKK